MADQLALDGIEPGAPKKKKRTRSAQRVDNPKRGYRPTFYGAEVPEPRDLLGQELSIGPLRVLMSTNGCFFIMDYRRPLGEGTVFVGGFDRAGKIAAVRWMVDQAKSSTGPATSRSG